MTECVQQNVYIYNIMCMYYNVLPANRSHAVERRVSGAAGGVAERPGLIRTSRDGVAAMNCLANAPAISVFPAHRGIVSTRARGSNHT